MTIKLFVFLLLRKKLLGSKHKANNYYFCTYTTGPLGWLAVLNNLNYFVNSFAVLLQKREWFRKKDFGGAFEFLTATQKYGFSMPIIFLYSSFAVQNFQMKSFPDCYSHNYNTKQHF